MKNREFNSIKSEILIFDKDICVQNISVSKQSLIQIEESGLINDQLHAQLTKPNLVIERDYQLENRWNKI